MAKSKNLNAENIKSIRRRAFDSSMGIADGTLTIPEVVQRAFDISSLDNRIDGFYFLLNVASFLPDYYELQIRQHIRDLILNEKA